MTNRVPLFGEDIRQEFILREKSVFVNHGSYGTIPKCVHQRRLRYMEEMESHPDIWYRYSLEKYLPMAAEKVAQFVGVDAKDTFLMQNVTKAVNTVLKCYPLSPGDAFLITNLTYSAVRLAARHTTSMVNGCQAYALEIQFPIHSEDDIIQLYDEFLTTHPDVRLAVIDHITSPSSVLMPIKRLTEVCHKHGVIVLIDAAHAPGQLKLDLVGVDAEFYTGNLHKWVYAPRGCAFLWMNPARKQSWLRPLITACCHGEGLNTEFAFEGTKDDTGYLCAIDAIEFYNSIGGLDVVTKYTSELRKQAVFYLEKRLQTERLGMPDCMVPPNLQMVLLPYIPKYSEHPEKYGELQKLIVDVYDVQTYIHVVGGRLCVRVSTQVYNTMNDYVKLADALIDVMSKKNEE